MKTSVLILSLVIIPSLYFAPVAAKEGWLSGPAKVEITPCRAPLYKYLLTDSGLINNQKNDEWVELAKKRVANLTNRIVHTWYRDDIRNFKGRIPFLLLGEINSHPIHYDYDLNEILLEEFIEQERNCRITDN